MKQHGYTLIECAISLILISLVTAMGLPSFNQMLRKQALDAARTSLVSAIYMARHEAVHRSQPVTLLQREGDWNKGWTVILDIDMNGELGAADIVIRQQSASAANVHVSGNLPVSRYIRYMPDGTARLYSGAFQAGTLAICHASRNMSGIKLVLSSSGRLRQESTSCE